MLNIFIIGKTKVGKTYIAKKLAHDFNMRQLSASEWVKARTSDSNVESLTNLSCEILKNNPDACTNYLKHRYNVMNGRFVIDGIRNPRDFNALFRPERDVVIFVHCERIEFASNFEKLGIDAIERSVNWMVETGAVVKERVLQFKIFEPAAKSGPCSERDVIQGPSNFWSLWNTDEVVQYTKILLPDDALNGSLLTTVANTHAEIPSFQAYVDESVLYNNDLSKTCLIPCTVFGVSSYKGSVLTFEILLNNGAVFSYVPPHKLQTKLEQLEDRLNLDDLVYVACPSENFSITTYKALEREEFCSAHFISKRKCVKAKYITTIDWYANNVLMHLLKLENGQLAALPSHKVMFSNEMLPDYKKLRSEWTLNSDDDVCKCGHLRGMHIVTAFECEDCQCQKFRMGPTQ